TPAMKGSPFAARSLPHLPLVFAVALFLAVTCYLLAHAAFDAGDVVYSLDDGYIHMAIAKNLVRHGVWGVTPWEFTSASSSPLWVALLAVGFFILGPHVSLPLALAGLSSILLLAVASRALRGAGAPAGQAGFVLLVGLATLTALALFTSLPALTMQGMEHPLHAALTLLAALLLSRIAADDLRSLPWPALLGYGALFAALPLLRYESLWLVAAGAILLLLRRRYALAAIAVAAALLPLTIFGLWMVAQAILFCPRRSCPRRSRPRCWPMTVCCAGWRVSPGIRCSGCGAYHCCSAWSAPQRRSSW